MSKLWNYLTGKKPPEPSLPPPIYMAPRPTEPVVDLRSVVLLRKRLDRIPNYRHPFTPETDVDRYNLFSLFHHFPDLKVVWESISKDFIENKSLLKQNPDNVCHHRLNERVTLLKELYEGLRELSNISNMVPYSLVHLLLVTLQDVLNQSIASPFWQYSAPFQLHSASDEIRKLSDDLIPLLGLVEYFITMDESPLLLSSEFLNLYLKYVQFLTDRLEAVSAHRGEAVAETFVKLYYYAVHCVFALGRLHKMHLNVSEESCALLDKVLLCLQECAHTCYKTVSLKSLTQTKYPFQSLPESHLFSRFSLGDRDKYDPNLTFLKYLTKLSKSVDGVSRLVLHFFVDVVLIETVQELEGISDFAPIDHRALTQTLIVMDILQSLAKADPIAVQQAVVRQRLSFQSLVRVVMWSSFDWPSSDSSHTYHTKATVLEQFYSKLDAISLAALAGTDHETVVFAFFDQVLSEDLEARAQGKAPLPQVYTLEFLHCYLSMVAKNQLSYERIIHSDLMKIVFAPLLFVMSEEGENVAKLTQLAAAYMNEIYKIILMNDKGKQLIIEATIVALHVHKRSPAYLNQVTSLLFFLVSEHDPRISHFFASCQIADNIYQIIQELRRDRDTNKKSLESLELMLIKILEMPQISAGVITNETFLNKFMNEQLFSPETSEFCIQCVSNLMRLSNSEYLYRQYVVTLDTARDEEMFKWLIQGVERTVKGTQQRDMCQKEFMDAELFDVLFKKLDLKGNLSMCSLILPTIRVILEGNFQCKSQFTRVYLSRLQQVLTRVLKQDQLEALGLVLDNLLFILFESDDLSRSQHFLRYPEIAPLVLELLQHFPDVGVPQYYVGVFARLAEESSENRVILAHNGCIRPLLALLSMVAEAQFRDEIMSLIAVLCLQYLAPFDLRAVVAWIARDSAGGVLSKEGKNLVGLLSASCRKALEALHDHKRPLPRCYLSFTGKETPISVMSSRVNPLLLPGRGFSIMAWIRPIVNPEAMFSNIFTLSEGPFAAVLNVTASGALQFMLSEGDRQVFETLTEREKLVFNQWNLVCLVCAQKSAKKDDFAVFINGGLVESGEIRPSKFPREMYSKLSVGGNSAGDSFTGQIATFYLFAAPATEYQVSVFYKLGPDYEGFLQTEEIVSARVRDIDRLVELKLALSVYISPRYSDLKGRLLDASPTSLSSTQRRPPREFSDTSAARIIANRTPDSLNLCGGAAILIPLLYRIKDKSQLTEVISECFYLISDLFQIPSHMTVRAICRENLCEYIRMVLEELAVKVEVEPGLVRCVVRMVDHLEWNQEARHRAHFALLQSFRFWAKLDWDLQKELISHAFRLLPAVRNQTDPTVLSSALSLLRTYFATSRPLVDREQLPAKREYIWNVVYKQVEKQSQLGDQDVEVVIENLLFSYSYSRDDLPDLVRFTRFLLEKSTLKLTDDTKEAFNKSVMFLLRKCGKKGLTGLQADLLNAIRECYLTGKGVQTMAGIIQKQISRVMSLAGEATAYSAFRFKSENALFEILNCMLPRVLTLPVYTSLVQILLGGVRVDFSLAAVRYPQVLDLITSRLSNITCAEVVYQDLKLLADQHIALLYESECFPAWLLQLFIYPDEDESDTAKRDLLFSLCKTIFTKGFLTLRNPAKKLRLFVSTFMAREMKESWKFAVAYKVLGDLLDGLDISLTTGHAANVRKEVYYNLHDFAYLLEDITVTNPSFASDPSFPQLLQSLLEACKKLKLCMSSYPPFPCLGVTQTLEILAGALQSSVESGDGVRLREGGMMRALLSLLLLGITHSRSELPSPLIPDLMYLLNGGSEHVSLSAFSAANKITCETILQDDSSFRFLPLGPTETAGDLLYSEQFVILYAAAYFSEALYERAEKGLECLLLGALIRDLAKKYNFGQMLNAAVARETTESIREVQEFHKRHPQLFPSLVSTNSRLTSPFSRYEVRSSDDSDEGIELKNFQSQVKSLTLELNKAANGGVEGVLHVVQSEEWRERVHRYLAVHTLAKLLALDKSVRRLLPPGEVHFARLEPHPELVGKLLAELKLWKRELFQRIHQKEKEKDRTETLERLYTKRRWRKYLKLLSVQQSGLWAADSSSLFAIYFYRLVNRFDRENRHFLLQPDPMGSSHSEAINRKHLRELERSPLLKRKTITSIDPDDPEQRELLKSFPSLPADTDELIQRDEDMAEGGDTGVSVEESSKVGDTAEEEVKAEAEEIPVQDTAEDQTPVYTYPDSFEMQENSLVCDCERICLKGAIFGKLELTPQFLLFKSTREMKPPGVYFGSALACSQIALESELVWDVKEITEVFSRRFHHLYTAVEVFVTSGKGYYFNCFSEAKRLEVLKYFKHFHKIRVYFDPKKEFRQSTCTKDWQRGALSNFEYLMALNKFASRSYNDLNQYPVFPWVLKDYSSPVLNLSDPSVYRDLKIPIGAIHPDGLRECTRRYALWTEDPIMKPFHFGSHYSSEGIVLHYLLRIEPYASKAIMLQDGTFDVADRLFFSIPSAYEGSTKSSGDVKELIPEFFYLPEMFENRNNYELGKRQTGETVMDVELPKWARSPHDFIRQHRKALESLYISDNLHHWIDLIFGYQQWGEAAAAVHNVFFCFTYEQHVVPLLRSTTDTASMEGVIQQIGQFGQTPVQLFDFKHERRSAMPVTTTFYDRLLRDNSAEVTPYSALIDPANSKVVAVFALRSRFFIVQDSMLIKIVKWRQGSAENYRPEPSRSQGEVEQPLENAFPYSGDFPRSNAAYAFVWPYLISGLHWDNSFKMHEFETGKLQVSMVHHLDLVTCVAYNAGVLVTGSLDSTLAVWEVRSSKSQKVFIDSYPALTLLGHYSGLKQCQVSSSQRLVVSLALDSTVIIHSLYDGMPLHRIDPDADFTPTMVCFSGLGAVACCSREHKTVRVYSCNGRQLHSCGKKEALANAKQMFFSASGEFVTVMCNTAIFVLSAYGAEHEVEITLEHVPAAITSTTDDQNLVGVSHSGCFFRVDAEAKRAAADIYSIYDPQGFKDFK